MKETRIIVKMSQDLKDWVHSQAIREDLDEGIWVRMQLAKIGRGEGIPALRLPRAVQLEVQEPIYDTAEQQIEEHSEPVDTEALIANALEDANIQPPPTALIPPPQGVRSLRKPQTPLTGGNVNIDRYLGR